jgi:hypothetical protein
MQTALAENICDEAGEESANELPHTQNLGSVLLAIADVMGDTIAHFEEISSRITQIVLTTGGAAQRDLIVELQAFDRLQQEFTAFSKTFARCAAATDGLPWNADQDAQLRSNVIAGITVADLRWRLLRRFSDDRIEHLAPSPDDEQEF